MVNTSEKKNYFGFLRYEHTLEFERGTIPLLPSYKEGEAWIEKYLHEDGFLYPPLVSTYKCKPITLEPYEKKPRTERPALLQEIPPSHDLLFPRIIEGEDIRNESGAFIIHLLSYLFGTRLQFYDWRFDRRVPIERTNNIYFTKETAEHFISKSYNKWLTWNNLTKTLFINLLYMHSRSPSYEWDWERFIIDYMVFDSCFKVASLLNILGTKKNVPHKDRIKNLCSEFEIPFNDDLANDIVELRNNLFHETIWDKTQPCGYRSGSEAHLKSYHLRRLNQRLIPALLDYKTKFINTGWWYLGQCLFEKE